MQNIYFTSKKIYLTTTKHIYHPFVFFLSFGGATTNRRSLAGQGKRETTRKKLVNVFNF